MQTALLLKSLSLLAGIIALIYLCFYLYRRKAGGFFSSQQRIIIVEKRAIDQRTTLSLVRIDDREMLVVSTHQGVQVHALPETILQKSFKNFIATKNAVQ